MPDDLYKYIIDNPQVFISIVAAAIASISAIFNIYSFRYKNNKEISDANKKLKVDWLKSLVLDYNLEDFYKFFDDVEEEIKKLQIDNPDEEMKVKVIEKINDYRFSLRRKFIDLLLAVDNDLYNSTLAKLDKLVDNFTEVIADEGIILKNPRKFEELILNQLTATRTDVIKGFIQYKGEEINPSYFSSLKKGTKNKIVRYLQG